MTGIGPAARPVVAALSSITRREVAATFALGVLLFAYHIPAGLVDPEISIASAAIFVADQIKAFAMLPAYVLVDRLAPPDPPRRWPWVVAACAGALVSSPLAVLWTSGIINRFVHPVRPHPMFMVYIGIETAILGSAVFWIIADRARARRARERMHQAELARIDAERRSVESDLQALQARVEPGFLFSTLNQVKDLYDRDAALGERTLDELIAYLRAAMPQMRDTSSTLAREIDLVRAYVAIVGLRLGDRLNFRIRCPDDAPAVRMPPMMLLPLVDLALCAEGAQDRGIRRFELCAEIDSAAVQVTLRNDPPGRELTEGSATIDSIRERLFALYGSRASLALGKDDEAGVHAVIAIPAERRGDGSSAGHSSFPS